MYVVKYDASGNVLWAKSSTGGGTSSDLANSVAVDGSGNSYIAGYYSSPTIQFGSTTLTNAGNDDMYIAKLGAPPVSKDVAVNKRWNLISNPVQAANDSLKVLYPSALTPAYSYNQGSGYTTHYTLSNGVGYWEKFPSAQTVTISGSPLLSKSVPVQSGWNLVGSISNDILASSITPSGTSIQSDFYGYAGSYLKSDTIKAGKGYWVKASTNGNLLYTSGIGIPKSLPKENLDALNSLTVSDADGDQQTLYFGKSEPKPSQVSGRYELPPLPPAGNFDARYGTGTYAELISDKETKKLPIQISSATYPVILSWQMNDRTPASLVIGGKTIALHGKGSATVAKVVNSLMLNFGGSAEIPKEFALEQNYPNPFNPVTTIRYALPKDVKVALRIYNTLGQLVITLVDGAEDAGNKSIDWDASNNASGIYFYRLEAVDVKNPANSFTQVKKMLLLK
jgi:hypothetical protein